MRDWHDRHDERDRSFFGCPHCGTKIDHFTEDKHAMQMLMFAGTKQYENSKGTDHVEAVCSERCDL